MAAHFLFTPPTTLLTHSGSMWCGTVVTQLSWEADIALTPSGHPVIPTRLMKVSFNEITKYTYIPLNMTDKENRIHFFFNSVFLTLTVSFHLVRVRACKNYNCCKHFQSLL